MLGWHVSLCRDGSVGFPSRGCFGRREAKAARDVFGKGAEFWFMCD